LLEASNVLEAANMGRPIGSVNRPKPFTDALRVALLSGGGRRLRAIAERLAEKAEQGDLAAIQQIADRLDRKCAQVIERGDMRVEAMTDQQLMAVIRGGSRELLDEPSYARICGPVEAKSGLVVTRRFLCFIGQHRDNKSRAGNQIISVR
jgi:hypothetical protein